MLSLSSRYCKVHKDQRVQLVLLKTCPDKSLSDVAREFQAKFPNAPVPVPSTITRLFNRFMETGSVHDKVRTGRTPSATSRDNEIDVLAAKSYKITK